MAWQTTPTALHRLDVEAVAEGTERIKNKKVRTTDHSDPSRKAQTKESPAPPPNRGTYMPVAAWEALAFAGT